MAIYKTPIVADLLGIGYHRLINLLRSRRLVPPQKDTSGDYVWHDEDVERARQALAVARQSAKCPVTHQGIAATSIEEGSQA